jgi:hypothetical protein
MMWKALSGHFGGVSRQRKVSIHLNPGQPCTGDMRLKELQKVSSGYSRQATLNRVTMTTRVTSAPLTPWNSDGETKGHGRGASRL